MPKHKKKQESDSNSNSDSDSGPDDLNPPKKSKTSTSTSKVLKTKDGESYWELDRMKRATVREFRGKIFVDIREFYEKNGDFLPGKKGIALSASQWGTLKGIMNEIDDALRDIA